MLKSNKILKNQNVIAVGIFILINIIIFFPFFIGKGYIAPTDTLMGFSPWKSIQTESVAVMNVLRSDVIDYYIPYWSFFQEQIKQGTLPFWNPLSNNGAPFLGIANFALFSPLVLPFLLLFSLPLAFSLIILTKSILLGLFMYLYLKRMNISFASSVIGGIVYMLSGFNIVWLSWPHTLVTVFAPLLLLTLENLLAYPVIKKIIPVSLVVATLIFGGFPAVAGYIIYFSAFYVLVRSLQYNKKIHNFKKLIKRLLLSIAGIGVGLGVSAIQLIPTIKFLDIVDISYRSSRSLSFIPIKNIIQQILPNFYGNQVFYNWHGHGNLNETSGYIGIISVIILLYTLIVSLQRKKILPLFFTIATLVSLLIVYKIGPLLEMIHRLPIFDSSPSTRILSIFALCGAISVAYGIDLIIQTKCKSKARLKPKIFFMLISGIIALIILSKIWDVYKIIVESNFKISFEYFRQLTTIWEMLVLLLFLWLLFTFKKQMIAKKTFLFGIFLVILLDLLAFSFRQNPVTDKKFFYPVTPAIEYLKQNQEPYARMLTADRMFMQPSTQLVYGLNGFAHNFVSRKYAKLIDLFSARAYSTPTAISPTSENTNFLSPIIDLFGIKYIVLPTKLLISSHQVAQTKVNNDTPILISKNITAKQTFTIKPEKQRIQGACLLISKVKNTDEGLGYIIIKNDKLDIVAQTTFSLSDIINNSWNCNIFYSDVLDPGDYILELFTDAEEKKSMTVHSNKDDIYTEGEAFVNTEKINGDFLFRVSLVNDEIINKYKRVYLSNDLTIFENNNHPDGAFLVDDVKIASNADEAYSLISSPQFNPNNQAIVEADPADNSLLKIGKINSPSKVSISKYSANEIVYQTESSENAFLATTEINYPGWKIYVDNNETKIYQTNYVFRGNYIPQGKHEIRYIYKPIFLIKGLYISIASLIILVFAYFVNKRSSGQS